MTAWDLFLFVTLPLLVTFLALIFTLLYTGRGIPEKLGKIEAHTSRLPTVEIHTSRLPAIEQKLDALLLLVRRGQGGQSVVVKLEKTGLNAVVSLRDKQDDTIEVLIYFPIAIIPTIATNILHRWAEIGKGQITGSVVTPQDILLKVKGADPEATASALKEFLARFDQELSQEKEWEARFEKGFLPQP